VTGLIVRDSKKLGHKFVPFFIRKRKNRRKTSPGVNLIKLLSFETEAAAKNKPERLSVASLFLTVTEPVRVEHLMVGS
jgi:hypothetical protein